jgi:hypothetical protein
MSLPSDPNSESPETPAPLDRIWEATRPAEPSAAAWERVWGHVTAGLRQSPATIPMPRTSRGTRGPWAWIALASVAQAAAVLVAGGIYLQTQGTDSQSVAPEVAVATPPPLPVLEFELKEGQTLIVEVGERADRLVIEPTLVDTASLMVADLEDAPPDPYTDAIAFSMDILNVMEAIDEPATVVDSSADDHERGGQPASL